MLLTQGFLDAQNAANCALAMENELRRLNQLWQERALPPVRIRVGIYTGTLVAGSIGSVERMEYCVNGDTVNTAARLESYSKELPEISGIDGPCRIAVGDTTWLRLYGRYCGHYVGEVSLKGKQKKIGVYRLMGPKIETSVQCHSNRGVSCLENS